MALFFSAGSTVSLSLNLEDGAAGFYPRAYIFAGGAPAGDIDLGHIGMGRYLGLWVPANPVLYDVLYVVYADALHSAEAPEYSREMEKWQPVDVIVDALDRAGLPADTAAAVWDALLVLYQDPGSAGEHLGRLTAAQMGVMDDTNTRLRLVEKILRNRLELADGAADNWILYDDDSVTPLLRWSVSDKDGAGIVQQRLVPSRRTRGA